MIVNLLIPLPNPKHLASADRARLFLAVDGLRKFTTDGPPTYVDCCPHNVSFLRSSETSLLYVGKDFGYLPCYPSIIT